MPKAEQRLGSRKSTLKKGNIIFRDGMCVVGCTIKDLSATGAGLELYEWEDLPAAFLLKIAGGQSRECEVIWSANNRLGVRFVDEDPSAPAAEPGSGDPKAELLARVDEISRQHGLLGSQLDALRAEIKARL